MNPIGFLLTIILTVLILIAYNKVRVRGKLLCYFLRDDKSVNPELCKLQDDLVIHGNRGYDVCPDVVRVMKFPTGWPWILQELIPAALYDEEDAVPLNWVTLEKVMESAMNIKSALEENWIRKLVHEQEREAGGGFKLNWRKIFPIILMAGGAIGLIYLISRGGLNFGG